MAPVLRRSLSGRVLRIIGGEHPLGSADPPRLSYELGHLIEVDTVEPDQDRRVAVVMGRDEKRARLGLEQLVALLQAGAAHKERIGQLVNAEEQGAAHPEGGEAVIRLLDASGQGQGDPADVFLGHHLRIVRQLRLTQQLRPLLPHIASYVRRQQRLGCGPRARGSNVDASQ